MHRHNTCVCISITLVFIILLNNDDRVKTYDEARIRMKKCNMYKKLRAHAINCIPCNIVPFRTPHR